MAFFPSEKIEKSSRVLLTVAEFLLLSSYIFDDALQCQSLLWSEYIGMGLMMSKINLEDILG